MSAEQNKALAALRALTDTCKSASTTLSTFSHTVLNTTPTPVRVLRNDMISISCLIHTSTTRLSLALGKPPPSYSVALVPLEELTTHVAQLSSCVSTLPPGALHREAVWATKAVLHALETLIQHFESRCRESENAGDEYLAMTGAVHDAVAKAEKISSSELEAVAKAWRINGESLEDSLQEVNEMMKVTDAEDGQQNMAGDGWDELGEGFGEKLDPEAIERVKMIYPLLRFATLLHARFLTHHILKPPHSGSYYEAHLTKLLQLSQSLSPAIDELVSALYAPQHLESIHEAIGTVHQITDDFRRELATEADEIRVALELLQLQNSDGAKAEGSKARKWFEQCFSQLDVVYDNLKTQEPS